MKRKLSISLLVVAALAAACVPPDEVSTGTDSTVVVTTATTSPPTSVLRTIPEEASTTTIETTTTVEEELGPPPEPLWLDEDFELVEVASLNFPVAMTTRTGDDDLWVAERSGVVRRIQRRELGSEVAYRLDNTVVLDIRDQVSTDGEGGLLGLAFSSNGLYLYASYTNNSGNSVVAEYEVGAIEAFDDTERILIEVEQPFSNHNGGDIAFGPDGFLYVALGDGGSGGDPEQHGQNPETLLGTILRIDPAAADEGLEYRVPRDNPFASGSLPDGTPGQPEVWLWGVRNPWRFSFDADNGDMWIADVGQNALEEINVLRNGSERAGRGLNLGWRTLEGDQFFDGDEAPARYAPPVFTYDRSNNRCSVTGGYVSRDDRTRSLDGVYIFGDYCTGEIFGLQGLDDGRIIVANLRLNRAASQVVSFGEGSESELYVFEQDGPISLIRQPGRNPSVRVVDSDQPPLVDEVDEQLEIEQVPEGEQAPDDEG